jgi:hypothetical protein
MCEVLKRPQYSGRDPPETLSRTNWMLSMMRSEGLNRKVSRTPDFLIWVPGWKETLEKKTIFQAVGMLRWKH